MVEALVGGAIKRPHRNRGRYVNFPQSNVELTQLGPHNDTMPADLFGMAYISEVPACSGGTTIWPTSPQRLWPCLETEHNCGFNPTELYSHEFDKIISEVEPVEFVGGAGDVMFLHLAMIHSAGVNSAQAGAGTLRDAVVMEWQRARPAGPRTLWWTLLDNTRAPMRGPRDRIEYNTRARPDGTFSPALDGRDPADDADLEVQVVWHHDAAEYMPLKMKNVDAGMWEEWSFSDVKHFPDIVVEEPWWERHQIPVPKTIFKLKDIATLDTDAGIWRIDEQKRGRISSADV